MTADTPNSLISLQSYLCHIFLEGCPSSPYPLVCQYFLDSVLALLFNLHTLILSCDYYYTHMSVTLKYTFQIQLSFYWLLPLRCSSDNSTSSCLKLLTFFLSALFSLGFPFSYPPVFQSQNISNQSPLFLHLTHLIPSVQIIKF